MIKKGVFVKARQMTGVVFILALFSALSFSSCDNVSGSSGSSVQSTSVPSANSNSKEKIIVRGSLGVSGALPKSVKSSIAAASADNSSRSAQPTLNTTDYYYYVLATPQDDVGNVPVEYGKDDADKFFPGENGIQYELGLAIGKWKIECGLKNSDGKSVLRDISDTIDLTPENNIVSKDFIAAPVQDGGDGSLALKIGITYSGNSYDVKKITADCFDSAWGGARELTETTSWFELEIDPIPAAAYDVIFNFYNEHGVMLYQTNQTINVLSGMKTDTWATSGGVDDDVIDNETGSFSIGPTVVATFKRNILYVGDTKSVAPTAKNPDDANDGGAYAPFATVKAAVDAIADLGKAGNDYKIFVCGTVVCNAELSDSLNTKARSIEIAGFSSSGSNAPADALDGKKSGSVLTVSTSVPVKIKNLQITNGRSSAGGGGISMSSGAKVTLGQGALIGKPTDQAIMDYNDCGNSGNKGGGILVDGASLVLESGSSVQGNYGSGSLAVGSGGGGISVINGGSLVIGEGAEVCKNASSGPGGGIYVGNNSSVTVNGGIVNQNKASNYGGGFYLDAEAATAPARLELNGGQINQNASIGEQSKGFAKGGGIYASKNGQIQIKGGQINKNTAGKEDTRPASGHTYGAGVYIHASTAQMTNGEISENEGYAVHDSDRHCGSAVAVMEDAEFSISGGTISKNKIGRGVKLGAIYVKSEKKTVGGSDVVVKGTLKISGSASIPYDSEDNAQNYVYLEAEDSRSGISESAKDKNYSPILVGNLSGGYIAASVYAQNWLRGKQVLAADGVTDLTTLKDKLSFVERGISFAVPTDQKTMAKLMSPFYVSDTGSADTNPGTYDKPYQTFAHAIEEIVNTNAAADYTIRIKGKVSGARAEVTNSITSSNCTGLTIEGAADLPENGLPTDVLDRAAGDYIIENGSALVVNSTVPVTIQKLKITGGKSTLGGGINVGASGATVRLGDGAWITGNCANPKGGGVAVANGAFLYMYGKALIGDKTASTATGTSSGQSSNYVFGSGGGIYNEGSLYIGYERLVSGNPIQHDMAEGFGVRYNYSGGAVNGGGIYSKGSVLLNSGAVSYNCGAGIALEGGTLDITGGEICANSGSYGAGVRVYAGSATMSGGTIGGAEDKGNDATHGGGAVYVNFDKTFKMTGGTISWNKMSGESGSGGGAIYLNSTSGSGTPRYGTFEMTGGVIANNTAANGQGGAVFCEGILKLSGKASIPYGVATTSGGTATTETGAGKNDVYIYGSRTITTGSFSTDAPQTVATITMPDGAWIRGRKVLDAADGVSLDTQKFKTSDQDFSIDVKPSDASQGIINAPFCVAALNDTGDGARSATDSEGRTWGAPSDAAGTRGSRGYPYATMGQVTDAIEALNDKTVPYEILINGTIEGANNARASFNGAYASSITMRGANGDNSRDALDANSLDATTDSSVLIFTGNSENKIAATIKDLKITRGKAGNGGGINIAQGSVELASGAVVSGNSATYNGGGVYVSASGTLNISNGSVLSNSSKFGGGIYVATGGKLEMTGGAIGKAGSLNTASSTGGAVYNNGTFNIKGTVSIPAGSGEKDNDVALYYSQTDKTIKNITVDENFASESSIAITPTNWVRGKKVVDGASQDQCAKFQLTDSNFAMYDDSANRGIIDADLYVAQAAACTISGVDYGGGLDLSNGGRGTKAYPLASIEEAMEQCWNGPKDKVTDTNADGRGITIVGTLTDQQNAPGTVSADTVTLKGVNSDATIHPSSGSAFTIPANLPPIAIKSLTITGGSISISGGGGIIVGTGSTLILDDGAIVTGNSTTYNGSGGGGGIYAAGSSAKRSKIIMKSGSKVIGNTAAKMGGGIYLKYADLCMSGSAIIGDATETIAEDDSEGDTSKRSNKAATGGGVYASLGSILWLGYTDASDDKKDGSNFTGGIRRNFATGSGGGIYASQSTVKMAGGYVSYNATAANETGKNGGGIWCDYEISLSGGQINRNKAYYGGGVYNNGGKVFMTGTALIGGSGTDSASESTGNYSTYYGGGVYNTGNIYFGYDSCDDEGKPGTATNNTKLTGGIKQNYAENNGGGIYSSSGKINFNTGNLSLNGSKNYGGGLFLNYSSSIIMTGGTMASNLADVSGGAVAMVVGPGPTPSTFSISGSTTSIVSSGAKNNDISIPSSCSITVAGDLASDFATKLTMNANNTSNGTVALSSASGSAADIAYVSGNFKKFSLTNANKYIISNGTVYENQSAQNLTDSTNSGTFAACSQADLKHIKDIVNGGNSLSGVTIKLANDVTLTGSYYAIGAYGKCFSGTFDGNAKTITYDNASLSGNNPVVGVIAFAKNATIKNLNVAGTISSIGGNNGACQYCGTIVGEINGGSILNCSSSANITYNFGDNLDGRLGGIVGGDNSENNTVIDGCIYTGTVTASCGASKGQCGGIIGIAYNSEIRNCINKGTVNATTGVVYAGGIAGQIFASGTNIRNCGNTGSVTGANSAGICGNVYGSGDNGFIQNIWSSGLISKTSGGLGFGILAAGAQNITSLYFLQASASLGWPGGTGGVPNFAASGATAMNQWCDAQTNHSIYKKWKLKSTSAFEFDE